MPKYSFQCTPCELEFSRTLKMANHPDHECPKCGESAPRAWESFGFSFALGGSAPANSGVSKHDHPTADHAVGRDADARWEEYRVRDKIKKQVRTEGGTHALIRKNGKNYIDYQAGGANLIPTRKKLSQEASEVLKKPKGS